MVFELCVVNKKKKQAEEENEEDDEQHQNFHVWFLNLIKVSGTDRVGLAIE